MGREKMSCPNGQLWKPTKITKIKELGEGVGNGRALLCSLALYLVVWLAVSVLEIVSWEWMPSLKWTPQQSQLQSGTCTAKRNQLPGLRYYRGTPLLPSFLQTSCAPELSPA